MCLSGEDLQEAQKISMRKTQIVFGAAFLVSLCSLSRGALSTGQVAYYPLMVNAHDLSGKGNHGAVIGYDWKFSRRLFLNTNSPPTNSLGYLDASYVIAPRSPSLDFNSDFTLSVWMKIPDGLPAHYVHNLIGNGLDSGSANFRMISDADDGGSDYLQFVCN